MSFLFPLYLLGAAAVAIPILLHLRRRPPQELVPFSAVMFLDPAPVPPVKRRKLEDILLLALRCLALVLLALMFSRPLFSQKDPAAAAGRSWVLLLDQSASMRRDDIRAQLAAQIDAALGAIREDDDVTFVKFEREPKVAAGLDAWRAVPQGQRKSWLRQQALEAQPGWGGTDLGRALSFAAGLLDSGAADSPQDRRVALISDLQEGASLDALGNFAWPQSVSVNLHVVQPRSSDNLSLSVAARLSDDEAEVLSPSAKAAPMQGLRVRVTNAAGSRLEKFSLAWQDDAAQKVEGQVAPGGSRVLQAPPRAAEGDGVLQLTGDTIDFDNRIYDARVASRTVRVLLVCDLLSRSDPASPLFFFSRALKPGSGIEPVLAEKKPGDVAANDLENADLVVLAARLPDSLSAPLRNWLEKGHTLLWSLEANDDGSSLAKLAGINGLSCAEAAGQYGILGEIHFEHAMFKPFAESGVRDFSKIRFWKHRIVNTPDPGAMRELALFDDRSPAILECAAGAGRMVVMTSGWIPSESQLAVSSKFVPLIYSLLEYANLVSSQTTALTVGDPILLEPSERVAALAVHRPSGKRDTWNAIERPEFTETFEPGIYILGEGGKARHVAVNLPAAEGRIAPMNLSRLRDAGVRLSEGTTGVAAGHLPDSVIAVEDSRLEQRQKLWKIIAATTLVVLLLETLVAGLRRRAAAEPTTA
jgi:hypothetical protein